MRTPRGDAFQMLFVEIARPPDDVGRGFCEEHDVLAGAAAGLQYLAGPSSEVLLQHRPDRLVIAVERGRVETPVRLDPPAILAEFDDVFRHVSPMRLARSGFISFELRWLQFQMAMRRGPVVSLQVPAKDFLEYLQHAQRALVGDAVV